MPSSAVHTFTDPDEFISGVRGGIVNMTVTQRGVFKASVTRIDLYDLWMQRFWQALPRTLYTSTGIDRAAIVFLTKPATTIRAGVTVGFGSISRHGTEGGYSHVSTSPTSTGAMSLPMDQFASLGEAVMGRDLTVPKYTEILTPSPIMMGRLLRLHESAAHLAVDAPEVLAHPKAARGLEQALIEAMMGCLGGGEAREDGAAERRHAAIMRRFHRVIEEHIDEPIFVPELCRQVGASARTLLACCQEHLGMGPKHYLLLRRMHLVRRALRESGRPGMTVTEIAARYGFWQFGRFAVEYKALFGESPSATLARPV
jgi:AraC-like DNA-binding protein